MGTFNMETIFIFCFKPYQADGGNNEEIIKSFLKYGSEDDVKNWWTFVNNNHELIQQINKALDGIKQFDTLLSYFIKLISDSKKNNDLKLVKEFYNLNIEEIGIFAWRNLNPLLEKAVKLMNDVGLTPEAFFPK